MSNDDKKSTAKEALLRAAETLFTQRGFAAVSTREIAELAGVNLGAIAYHFGSKGQLFVETIRHLMHARHEANQLLAVRTPLASRQAAASELCRFFAAFLADICQPKGPDVCKLMYREVLDTTDQDSEMFETLVSSVVKEFIQPVDDHLRAVVTLINPQLTQQQIDLTIHSIIGQCAFYVTHRPFVERLRHCCLQEEQYFPAASKHIAAFTLRGLGLTETEIEDALALTQQGTQE